MPEKVMEEKEGYEASLLRADTSALSFLFFFSFDYYLMRQMNDMHIVTSYSIVVICSLFSLIITFFFAT